MSWFTFLSSLGEYAALVVAGVIELDNALTLVSRRSRLVAEYCEKASTGMMAIQMGPSEAEALLKSAPDFRNLSIACFNR